MRVLLNTTGAARRAKEQMLESMAEPVQLVFASISRDNGFSAVRCSKCKSYVERFDLATRAHLFARIARRH